MNLFPACPSVTLTGILNTTLRPACLLSAAMWLQTCRLLVATSDEHVVSDSVVASSSPSDTTTTAGIIVIAVVICVIMTSLVWFIVIYKSRRRQSPTPFHHSADTCNAACHRTMSSVSDADGSAQRLLAHPDFLHSSMSPPAAFIHSMFYCNVVW